MDDDDARLTPDEIKRLKKIAKEDERWEWFWANARRFAAGLTLAIGTLTLLWDQVKALVKAVVRAASGQ